MWCASREPNVQLKLQEWLFWVAILAPPHNPTLYWTSFFQKSSHTYSHSYFQSEKSRTETNQNNSSFLWRGSYLQICHTNDVSSQPPPPQKECCIQNQRKKPFNLTSSASHWHWKMLLKSKMAISIFFFNLVLDQGLYKVLHRTSNSAPILWGRNYLSSFKWKRYSE